MAATSHALSTEELGYLNYLRNRLAQPLGSWEGFYNAQSPSMNFALRYQLAFASYALAAMSQRTPAYRKPYAEAMRGGLEKMLHVAAWGYWRVPETQSAPERGLASSGHVAVLLSPHQRGPLGPPSDPIVRDNLQYSGHLSTMLGLYEKVSGDTRYDEPFTLHDPDSGGSYTYTHSEVAGRIFGQMRDNGFGGVCCERGMAYVPCNNYSLASNTLHDALHGTTYSRANGKWLKTVRDKMVLKGPAVRGVFGTSYVKDLHMATPVAFNFTDAWGLAFLMPFDLPLVRKLYAKFKKKVERAGSEGAYVGSSSMSERMEISDVPINTGFGLMLARGMGDVSLADDMQRYSEATFDAGWRGPEYLVAGAPRTLHTTALYALAGCIEPGAEGFRHLFHDTPQRAPSPLLESVDDPSGRVGVFQAEYEPTERVLQLGLRLVGGRSELAALGPVRGALTLSGIASKPHVKVDGAPLGESQMDLREDGILRFDVKVVPGSDLRCRVFA